MENGVIVDIKSGFYFNILIPEAMKLHLLAINEKVLVH